MVKAFLLRSLYFILGINTCYVGYWYSTNTYIIHKHADELLEVAIEGLYRGCIFGVNMHTEERQYLDPGCRSMSDEFKEHVQSKLHD